MNVDLEPIHLARNHKVAKLLLDAGADIEARTSDGNTPLLMAVDPDVLRSWYGIHNDIDEQRLVVQLLIDHGADVNAANRRGDTPLHKVQDVVIAKLLIEHGAHVNALNKSGDTPLDRAHDKKLREILIRSGAKKSR